MCDDIFIPEERNKLYFELIQSIIYYMKIDLTEMCNKLEIACFPILMSIFANIDFMGGLIYGFNTQVTSRSIKFIKKYMGKDTSVIYNSQDFAEYLIKNIRNKLVHEAFMYGHFETSKRKEDEEFHMTLIKYREDIEMVFIHPNKFKNDFFVGLNNFDIELKSDTTMKDKIINNFSSSFGINMLYSDVFSGNMKSKLRTITYDYLPQVERHTYPMGTSVMTSTDRKNEAIINFVKDYFKRPN